MSYTIQLACNAPISERRKYVMVSECSVIVELFNTFVNEYLRQVGPHKSIVTWYSALPNCLLPIIKLTSLVWINLVEVSQLFTSLTQWNLPYSCRVCIPQARSRPQWKGLSKQPDNWGITHITCNTHRDTQSSTVYCADSRRYQW